MLSLTQECTKRESLYVNDNIIFRRMQIKKDYFFNKIVFKLIYFKKSSPTLTTSPAPTVKSKSPFDKLVLTYSNASS
ncbi:hypothetical protein UT300010_25170 [Clostridium perfringens]|nr:hypothetical protein CPBEC4_08100 [Clostridium perfringens]